MWKAIVLAGFLVFMIFLGKCFYTQTTGKAVNNARPRLQVVNLPLPTGNYISALSVVDKVKVATIQSPEPDIVLFKVDQGSFRVSSVYQRDDWQLNRLDFVNSLDGFAVGNYGTILKTTDGGVSWTRLSQFSEYDFNQVKFLNPTFGYVAGKFAMRNPKTNEVKWNIEIYKTEDGGNSWTKSYYDENAHDVFQIVIVSSRVALASINGQRLIRTDDGGQTWQDVLYNGKQVMDITFGPGETGWLVGGKGEFLTSKDAGLTWLEPRDFPPSLHGYEWWSIDFDDGGKGLAVSEQGVVAYTYDSGKTWKTIPQKIDDHLRLVSLRDGFGVALGSKSIYTFDFNVSEIAQ